MVADSHSPSAPKLRWKIALELSRGVVSKEREGVSFVLIQASKGQIPWLA